MAKTPKKTAEQQDRERRMKWWHDARFGMFIHWGLYSQLGRHEWVMNRERIPVEEYDQLADTWKVKPMPALEWATLAKNAGMKYMVMTTKHHEGFCLWDTQQTDFNSVKRSPGRDLVKEYVDACRRTGLRVGFYYSLMDWHHPDGARCARSEAARRRFIDFTHGCVRELMSNYGKIDILWYDVAWPLNNADQWESQKMNAMARELQPDILINNRSHLPEDFGTPEEHIRAEDAGRAWEACMTFNGSWGYMPYAPPEDWLSARRVIEMLRQVTSGCGNLLLNIGPAPDGSVPPEAPERLLPVGKWLKKNAEAVYGEVDRVDELEGMNTGSWTRIGNAAYFWCSRWPAGVISIGGFRTKLKKVSILNNGQEVEFEQSPDRIILKGLPKRSPDRLVGCTILKMEFTSKPRQKLGCGCELVK